MTKMEMVQQALAVRGEATSEEIAAFIERWHGVQIAAKFIPIYRASIRDKELQQGRRAAQAAATAAATDAPPAEFTAA